MKIEIMIDEKHLNNFDDRPIFILDKNHFIFIEQDDACIVEDGISLILDSEKFDVEKSYYPFDGFKRSTKARQFETWAEVN
ncbi:MAG: hypothetical protein LBI13_11240 [Streptococcaceae bacterium]|jgi:hypothetical protein|nr:hypothetical protein [Streptococcaceae bacterium]